MISSVLRGYEAEDEVFYVDAMLQGTAPLPSLSFTLAELKTHLSMIPEHSVRWKSINQRSKDIHSPIYFWRHVHEITLFQKNADDLDEERQINLCRRGS